MITLLPVLVFGLRPRDVAARIYILPEENSRHAVGGATVPILRVLVISLDMTVRVVESLCSFNILFDVMTAERIFFAATSLDALRRLLMHVLLSKILPQFPAGHSDQIVHPLICQGSTTRIGNTEVEAVRRVLTTLPTVCVPITRII